MSIDHSEASFNHSCLKVPVDSLSRKLLSKCERLGSLKSFGIKEPPTKYQEPLSECNDFHSVKSYLKFYESIPDYTDLHHLSNEDFYSRLESLKITQKRFCSENGVLNPDKEGTSTLSNFKILNDSRPASEKMACCSLCCVSTEQCSGLDYSSKTITADTSKQTPPKITINSDNENITSDACEPESKQYLGYEADRESSNLQPGTKLKNKSVRSHFSGLNSEDESLFGRYGKRSRSLPISPGYGCSTPDLCRRFPEVCFRYLHFS